jgi:hypothetical protein
MSEEFRLFETGSEATHLKFSSPRNSVRLARPSLDLLVHDDQERRKFLSEARAIPPLMSGLMISSSVVMLESTT